MLHSGVVHIQTIRLCSQAMPKRGLKDCSHIFKDGLCSGEAFHVMRNRFSNTWGRLTIFASLFLKWNVFHSEALCYLISSRLICRWANYWKFLLIKHCYIPITCWILHSHNNFMISVQTFIFSKDFINS